MAARQLRAKCCGETIGTEVSHGLIPRRRRSQTRQSRRSVADGATYGHAAQQAGYPTRSGAYKAFWKAVDGREADAVDQTGRWSWSVWTRFRSGCGNRR